MANWMDARRTEFPKIGAWLSSFDLQTCVERAKAGAERYFAGASSQIIGLAVLARHFDLAAFSKMRSFDDLERFDIESWRTSIELRDLDIRCRRSKAIPNPHSPILVSKDLHTAIALALTGRQARAKTIVETMAADLPLALKPLKQNGAAAVKLGAVSVFVADYLARLPRHPVFQDLPTTLDEAWASRETYAPRLPDPIGLLDLPENTLIPLDMVYFNSKLTTAKTDPELTQLHNIITGSRYPNNDILNELDVLCASYGY